MTLVADGADVVGHGRREAIDVRRDPIAGREGDEQVAARVAAGPAGAGDAETGPLGQPLALVGEERRVRRQDHDDRAATRRRRAACRGRRPGRRGWGPRPCRSRRRPGRRPRAASHACRSWPGPAPPTVKPPWSASMTRDAVPIPPLNSWQTIPVPPPTPPSATGSAGRRLEGGSQVLGLDVEAVDVVEQAVVRLADDRQRPPGVGGRPACPPTRRRGHRGRSPRCGCW